MSRTVHFEIHASDPEKLIAFYTALFDWRMERWGEVEYWQITTGEPGRPGIDGGLVPRRGPGPIDGQSVNAFICTVQVEAFDETFAKAQTLGAGVALPKMPIPGIGWLAYLKDPDGNIFGIMQEDKTAK